MTDLGLVGPSWENWRTFAKCCDGVPLTAAEQPVFEQCTGRTRPPTEPPAEIYGIVGRRGGKGRVGAAMAVRAARRKYELADGETAVIGLAASDRQQAR